MSFPALVPTPYRNSLYGGVTIHFTYKLANIFPREQIKRESPFFPECQFGTILGLERDDVRRVLMSWPDINEADESVVRAINNSFNNLLGYPAKNKREWSQFISVSGIKLAWIFDKWKGRAPRDSYKVRDYFDDAM